MKRINKKSSVMKTVEDRFTMPIQELLRIKYVDEALPHQQIAEELDINYTTLIRWLRLAGIYSRRLNI